MIVGIFFGRSLSARVLWLTVVIIMLVELAILLPSLGRERENWLWDHVRQAHLAAYTAFMAGTMPLDIKTREDVLKLSGAQSIELVQPGRSVIVLEPGSPVKPSKTMQLDEETLAESTWLALKSLTGHGAPRLLVVATSPLDDGAQIQVIIRGSELAAHLRNYTAHVAALSMIIALATGFLIYAALDRLLVRPMRIMTASIVGFRADPEHAERNDLNKLTRKSGGEIAEAAQELQTMQEELRAALWRNARLAAVGTAVAKISHDLRNILTSALLVADRLQDNSDPTARRAARTLIPAVERAAELVRTTVDFAREGPPALTRTAVKLHDLVDEVGLSIRLETPNVQINNELAKNFTLPLDRTQIFRVLLNLMRNAAEAGCSHITISGGCNDSATYVQIADNGPGLPVKVQDHLFHPFTGSGRRGGTGLGLAIARDLVRAHGGDLTLAHTSPRGTVFMIELAGINQSLPAELTTETKASTRG